MNSNAQHMERLHRDGVAAVWFGEERFCSPYPKLTAGMPGIYVHDADERLCMFYPEIWKHRYGVHAICENVQVKIPVPPGFMVKADEHYSAETLADEKHPTGKTLLWRGKYWTCTGCCSSGQDGLLEVDLREVVLESEYKGPPVDESRRGPAYYTGRRFRQGKTWWVMTGNVVTLVPDGTTLETQPNLF